MVVDLSDVIESGKMAEVISSKMKEAKFSLVPAYQKLEEILILYKNNGQEIDLIMPALFEIDIEHNKTIPDGRSIWFAYAEVLHDDLCDPRGNLHRIISSNNPVSGSEVIQAIIDKLKLPQSSALIVAPLAGSMLSLGVNAFCRHPVARSE
jgi:hypothetical protein